MELLSLDVAIVELLYVLVWPETHNVLRFVHMFFFRSRSLIQSYTFSLSLPPCAVYMSVYVACRFEQMK